jgi:hypothetical protein
MTEVIESTGAAAPADSRRVGGAALWLRAAILSVFFSLLFFSLSNVSALQPAFHVGFSGHWRNIIFLPLCLTIALSTAFVFSDFSFGYFSGFYLYTMIAGFFWVNAFSGLAYDHNRALISAAASVALFLMPSLVIRAPGWTFQISNELFDRIPEGILYLTTAILIVCAYDGFHFVGLSGMVQYRNELAQTHSRLIEYVIGNINGALIPFAFACFLVRKRWLMLTALCAVSLLFYPVTLTKISLLVAPFMIFMAAISSRFEARTCVILSLLVPLIVGLLAVVGVESTDATSARSVIFMILNFRLLAIPAISLEHYFAFFSDHPLTHFCQISLLKPMIACPYSDQLGPVFANQYHLGNMNASLFATEGVASVGPMLAPIVALVCGLVIALGNKVSEGLPPRFVLISAAVIPHVLLNVPLSTALVSDGFGVLLLLWCVTPRNYFGTVIDSGEDESVTTYAASKGAPTRACLVEVTPPMATGTPGVLRVGKIYRLKFPGLAARVIKPPVGQASSSFPYLVESLFLRSRWYVNGRGEPAYPDAPSLVVDLPEAKRASLPRAQ